MSTVIQTMFGGLPEATFVSPIAQRSVTSTKISRNQFSFKQHSSFAEDENAVRDVIV
jgi:hypothetical protein